MFAAVGRTEMAHLYTIYSSILLLQVFTVGGVLANDNRTHRTFLFIMGTNMVWMGIVVFLSLDLAWNITGHHHGHSAGLFFLSVVFPAVAVLLYLVLSCIVVCRKLEVYSSLKYVAMALVTFAGSQLILFGASQKIAVGTQGRINGSMFSIVLDLVSVSLIHRFWSTITDDTWGDEEF
ncbi:hypothetical protein BGX30_006529 [Mortierella sp. GBA39]|nr:hypothetical protein BGX30_006529 [Mortierella sp. GBA39]